MACSSASPSARADPFIVSAGDLVYLWSDPGDREPETVFIYHLDTEMWTREVSKEAHPLAELCNGSCTVSGQCLYLYCGFDRGSGYDGGSGFDGGLYCGDLCELNIKNWTWRGL